MIAQLGMRGGPNWQPRVTDHYRFALTRPELDDLLIALATPRQVDALAVALEEGPRWTRCKRPTWASRSNGAKIVDPAPGQKPLAPTPANSRRFCGFPVSSRGGQNLMISARSPPSLVPGSLVLKGFQKDRPILLRSSWNPNLSLTETDTRDT